MKLSSAEARDPGPVPQQAGITQVTPVSREARVSGLLRLADSRKQDLHHHAETGLSLACVSVCVHVCVKEAVNADKLRPWCDPTHNTQQSTRPLGGGWGTANVSALLFFYFFFVRQGLTIEPWLT